MAKIGSLVYDVVADTKDFQMGMVFTRRELTAAKKLFIESRTPVEKFGLELDGMTRMIKNGLGSTTAYARTVAQLSVETKGGGRVAREYAESLRAQAQQILHNTNYIRALTREEQKQIINLRKGAVMIEREVRLRRKAAAAARWEARERARLAAEQERNNKNNQEAVPRARSWSNQVMALAKQIGFITAAYKTWGQVQQSVTDALDLQRSKKQFEIFTGSEGTAGGLIQELRDFASRTPLTFTASRQATTTLLQYGVASSDVMQRLKELGDISGGSTEQIQRLALAYGQITAAGRLMGQENRQLIEAGFNPLQQISQMTGESMADLKQRMADGEVSAREVTEALTAATSEGGRFADALKRIGEETDFGKIQIFRGEIEKLRADMGKTAAQTTAFGAGLITAQITRMRATARHMVEHNESDALLMSGMIKGTNLLNFALSSMIDQYAAARREMVPFKLITDEQTIAENKLEEEIRNKISALRDQQQVLMLGRDEASLDKYRRLGVDDQILANLERELRIVAQLKEADERRLQIAKEREQLTKDRERESDRFIRDNKRAAEQFKRGLLEPIDELRTALIEIKELEMRNFLTQREAEAARDAKMNEFIEREVKDAESKKIKSEQASVASRGSAEEFQLIARVANASSLLKDKEEQKRHEAAQRARKANQEATMMVAEAIEGLPEDFAEYFPEPVE